MILTNDDRIMHSLALQGGYMQFMRYYFDWEPLPNQFVAHYAPQPNVIHLGGVGSGKTMGEGMSLVADCMTTPYYLALNTSISSFQAKLMFDKVMPYLNQPRVDRFIKDIRTRPYPEVIFWNDSKFACMTAGHLATLIRGSEWDRINGDEFGYERYEETIFALRGRLRGSRPDGTYRKARLDITTTPTEVEWLRRWYDRGDRNSGSDEYEPQRYLSLRSTLFDNIHIPEWQRTEIMAGYTEEMVQQEIMALFPDWGDAEFPLKFIDACEDVWLNDQMEQFTNPVVEQEDGSVVAGTPLPGAVTLELPRVGVVRWELPYDPMRVYVLATDPGTSSPPKRNSPVIFVFDVTEKPYQLVFFHWVSGNGSYMPWLNGMKYALEKYRPLLRGIDATGTQKALDELVFEREGIPVDSVNFARDKEGMLNALKLLFQNHELRFPYIKGLRHQLRTYKVPDKDLVQDIVSALMVFAYIARFLPSAPSGAKRTISVRTPAKHHRVARSRRTNRRRRS
jgi:hypothetical protein